MNIPYKFVPREYQNEIIRFFLEWIRSGCSRQMNVCLRWSRRSGKTLLCMYLASFLLTYKTCTVYYIMHRKGLCLDLIHTLIGNSESRYLDVFLYIKSTNKTSGIIEFVNGSRLYLLSGSHVSNDVSSLVGTSPNMIIYSEYARHNPKISSFLTPAVIEKKALCIYESTPLESRDHFYELEPNYMGHKNWLFSHKTNDDTHALTDEELDDQKRVKTSSFINTEYYAEWPIATPLSKYVYRYLLDTLTQNRFKSIWDVFNKEQTDILNFDISMDLGYTDETVIIFCCRFRGAYYLIDCFNSNNKLIEYYIIVIQKYISEYNDMHIVCKLNNIYLPTDASNKNLNFRLTVNSKIRNAFPESTVYNLGKKVNLYDGIALVKSHLNGIYFSKSCEALYGHIYNYSKKEVPESEEDEKLYKTIRHTMASHFADALRYLIIGGEFSN